MDPKYQTEDVSGTSDAEDDQAAVETKEKARARRNFQRRVDTTRELQRRLESKSGLYLCVHECQFNDLLWKPWCLGWFPFYAQVPDCFVPVPADLEVKILSTNGDPRMPWKPNGENLIPFVSRDQMITQALEEVFHEHFERLLYCFRWNHALDSEGSAAHYGLPGVGRAMGRRP